MASIRIRGKPVYAPHTIIEELADLHGAIDPETGHMICHYYPFAPIIIDTEEGVVPGLHIGDCLTLVPGKDNVDKIIASTTTTNKIPKPTEYNMQALGLALAPLRLQAMEIEVRTPKKGTEPLVIVYKPDRQSGEQYAVLVWKCKKSKEESSPVLQV